MLRLLIRRFNSNAALVTPEHISEYAQNGAICIRGLLSSEQVALIQKGVDENLAHLSYRAVVASKDEDPGKFVEDFCTWQSNEAYKQIIFQSPLASVAAKLMQSTTARLYHDHMLTKEPGTQQHTPWHQDQPYYNIDGFQNVSFWIPCDPVSRASTLEFIAGSHRGPWLMPRTFLTSQVCVHVRLVSSRQAKWFPEGSLAELPDIDASRAAFDILGWALSPGDVVCFHMLTLHAAAGVDGAHRRRVLSVRFVGDDVRHAPRPWKTSPDFPGLAAELPAGAPLDHPLFPVLWPRK